MFRSQTKLIVSICTYFGKSVAMVIQHFCGNDSVGRVYIKSEYCIRCCLIKCQSVYMAEK